MHLLSYHFSAFFLLQILKYFMNSNKPVQLSQKIDYLNEKISRVHWQTKHSDDFELRLNFEQYIDNCINTILSIKDKSLQFESPSKKLDESRGSGKIYSAQKQKLDLEKKMMYFQMQELEDKQNKLEYDALHVKLLTREKQFQNYKKDCDQKKRDMAKELDICRGKGKFLQQQIEKLIGLNRAQQQEIEMERKQRNRAQIKYLQLRDKYQQQLGILQKFEQKKPKYLDRSTQGMKCTRYFTNISKGDGKGNGQKIILLKLPVTLQVNKIVYGITLGVPVNKSEILYYDKFQLYQKQIADISVSNQSLIIEYKKRKMNSRIILDKYQVRGHQIVIQLYGKGDSIMVHQ